MSVIVIYDPADVTVAGKVTAHHKSANTPAFDGVTDKLVNPDLSALSAVAQKYWKHSTGSIVEMSAQEKTDIDAIVIPPGQMGTTYRARVEKSSAQSIPDNAWTKLTWDSADYDPESSTPHFKVFETLYAMGRSSEAMEHLEFTFQLDNMLAKQFLGPVLYLQGDKEAAIAQFESYFAESEVGDSSWVRDLVIGGSDPETGQAYLDRHIPEITASMPERAAAIMRYESIHFYLFFILFSIACL